MMKAPLLSLTRREQRGWAASDVQGFYETHRNRARDLYPSERFFLPRLLPRVHSVLDVGCAAGGFCAIMTERNPKIDYTGMDIHPRFVRTARARFPRAHFVVGDGVHFSTPPETFDLVHSSGVWHLNSRYREMVRAGYQQTRRFLLGDVRLTRGPAVRGRLPLTPSGPSVPYLVLNIDRFLEELRSMSPTPRRISVRGYSHAPSADAVLSLREVIVAFALIEKGPGPTRVDVRFDEKPPTPAGRGFR